MCLISNNYNPDIGPILEVLVFPLTKDSISGALVPTIDPATPSKQLHKKRYTALIDTGASVTCISSTVFRERLPSSRISGMAYLRGVKGSEELNSIVPVPVYSVAIVFMCNKPPHVKFQNVQAPMIASIEKAENITVDVIVGMDLISTGYLSMNPRYFSLEFPKSN